MLSYWYLLEILKYLDRDNLERIQVTNRMLNDIVHRYFAAYPLRFVAQTLACAQVIHGELVLLIRNYNRCLEPNIRQWNCHSMYHEDHSDEDADGIDCFYIPECEHYYPVNEMRPFLCKNVRIRFVGISIDDRQIFTGKNFTPYTADHIGMLETISHIWAAQNLYLWDDSNDSTSLYMMLGSQFIHHSRTLHIWDNKKILQILQNPQIYTLYIVTYDQIASRNSEEVVLHLIQQKTSYPCSDTIFVLYCHLSTFASKKICFEIAMENIKQIFLTSEDPCRLRVIIRGFDADIFWSSIEFRLQNIRTNEVLELKHISEEEANEIDRTPITRPSSSLVLIRYTV